MKDKVNKIHFVGIGGIGMSGIALILKNLNYNISGSDLNENYQTDTLKKLGCEINIGHSSANIKDVDVVVISSAIPDNNPELIEAGKKNIPIIKRAEMLAELMRMKQGIAIAGTHGKTTTTSLIASIMAYSDLDPTIVIGGSVNAFGTNARIGTSNYFVVEADESDGSFMKLSPIIIAVTTIDNDHIDYYGNMENVKSTFVNFCNKVPFYGLNILNIDDKNIQDILPMIDKRIITYGMNPQADIMVKNYKFNGTRSYFDVYYKNNKIGDFIVNIPGKHNISNCLASIAIGLELEIPVEKIRMGLEKFNGVARRFNIRKCKSNILLIDDYGHHPTEIHATLNAIKSGWSRRTLAVFQPHRYSRTQLLHNEFGHCFISADKIWITKLYPAGEKPIENINETLIYNSIKNKGHKNVFLELNQKKLIDIIKQEAHPDDIIIILGAGDINKICPKLEKAINSKYEDI